MNAFASPLGSLALALAVFMPSFVEAQTLTLRVTQIGDKTFATGATVIANASHCSSNAAVTLSVTTTSGAIPAQLDVWAGAASANCHLAASRVATNTACRFAGHFTVANMLVTSVNAANIGGTSNCTAATGSSAGTDVVFTAIGTNTTEDRTTEMPYGTFTIRYDAQSPPAPTMSSTTLTGESVSVRWTGDEGSSEMVTYTVFIDSAGTCSDAGSPMSALLVPGMLAPAGAMTTVTSSTTSASVSATTAGETLPGEAVVAVATTDLSGNPGVLSGLACIKFVDTQGVCEGNPECSGNCAVRAPGARGASPFLLVAALASVALLVHTRRRRSAK